MSREILLSSFYPEPEKPHFTPANIIGCILAGFLMVCGLKFVLKSEKDDLYCPEGPRTKDRSTCVEGKGKLYHWSNQKQTTDQILDNICSSAKFRTVEIVWRRAFVIAFFSALFIWSVAIRKVPTFGEAIGTVLSMMFVTYAVLNWYSYHHTKHIEMSITEAVNILRNRKKAEKK